MENIKFTEEEAMSFLMENLIDEHDAIENGISLLLAQGKISAEDIGDLDEDKASEILLNNGYVYYARYGLTTASFVGYIDTRGLDDTEQAMVEALLDSMA